METIVLVSVLCFTNILCFYIGAKVGQTASKGEDIKVPNPVRAIEEHKETEASREEREVFETNLANIENYNGTSLGQRDFR